MHTAGYTPGREYVFGVGSVVGLGQDSDGRLVCRDGVQADPENVFPDLNISAV